MTVVLPAVCARLCPGASHSADDYAIDPLWHGKAFKNPAVDELQDITALRFAIDVELVQLGQESLRLDQLISEEARHRSVVSSQRDRVRQPQ